MRIRRTDTDEAQPGDLNMTPMIDIVFQLLIFFMLTMHFKEVEGKFISQLPKKGSLPTEEPPVELREIRVVFCTGNVAGHFSDGRAHADATRSGEVSEIMVERFPIGSVVRTETHPEGAARNKAAYAALGAKVKELHALIPATPGHPAPVILDVDREVPYEHVVGAINACKVAGIHNIEFTASAQLAERLR